MLSNITLANKRSYQKILIKVSDAAFYRFILLNYANEFIALRFKGFHLQMQK